MAQEGKIGLRVIYKNPHYLEIEFINIGSKYNKGIIKDYDGDYFIIKNEITKQEEYINKEEILKEVFRE